jgi:hypothetical protein
VLEEKTFMDLLVVILLVAIGILLVLAILALLVMIGALVAILTGVAILAAFIRRILLPRPETNYGLRRPIL